jgi:hypothetical protein
MRGDLTISLMVHLLIPHVTIMARDLFFTSQQPERAPVSEFINMEYQ